MFRFPFCIAIRSQTLIAKVSTAASGLTVLQEIVAMEVPSDRCTQCNAFSVDKDEVFVVPTPRPGIRSLKESSYIHERSGFEASIQSGGIVHLLWSETGRIQRVPHLRLYLLNTVDRFSVALKSAET